jgi:hypothetical protein
MAMERQPPSEPEPADADLAEEIDAERALMRAIIKGTLIATPVSIAVWIGLIFLALNGTGTDLAGPLAMAAGIGVLTGFFFGAWGGFVSKTHAFEELDRKSNLRRARGSGPPPSG